MSIKGSLLCGLSLDQYNACPWSHPPFRTVPLRVCSITEPGTAGTFHLILLNATCELLRYSREEPVTIYTHFEFLVPIELTEDAERSWFRARTSVCQGPQNIVYSTVTLGEVFCNPGHEQLYEFEFYANLVRRSKWRENSRDLVCHFERSHLVNSRWRKFVKYIGIVRINLIKTTREFFTKVYR